MTQSTTSDPIDAVVTWVDGADEIHRDRRLKALSSRDGRAITTLPSGTSSGRFADNNEIQYCLLGIRRFLPWIRTIYLVTDQQRPAFLDSSLEKRLGVTIVDHSDIFQGYEFALPNFNSQSIGSLLFRIPGISKRYIYFNDDVIPIRSTSIESFFIDNRVVLRGRWEKQAFFAHHGTAASGLILKFLSLVSKKERSAHLFPQMRSARMAGFCKTYFRSFHAPHAIYTDVLSSFFEKNERLLKDNIRHRFRDLNQFVAHPLAHHLAIREDRHVIQDGKDCVVVTFSDTDQAREKLELLESRDVLFVCLQGLESADSKTRDAVTSLLKDLIFS